MAPHTWQHDRQPCGHPESSKMLSRGDEVPGSMQQYLSVPGGGRERAGIRSGAKHPLLNPGSPSSWLHRWRRAQLHSPSASPPGNGAAELAPEASPATTWGCLEGEQIAASCAANEEKWHCSTAGSAGTARDFPLLLLLPGEVFKQLGWGWRGRMAAMQPSATLLLQRA